MSGAIQHVSVWLDDFSLDETAFTHGLEWASCLNLPLRGVAASTSDARWSRFERTRALGITCAQRGVTLETHLRNEQGQGAIEQFLRPRGLCVFDRNMVSPVHHELIRQSSSRQDICQLFCARSYRPIHRVLVLWEQSTLSSSFLASAARICHALETTPIILIVARAEREAEIMQSYVEGVCGSLHLCADFDSVVHGDMALAVSRVAAWRSCSHIIVERPHDTTQRVWWTQRDQKLAGPRGDLTDSISVLAIPEAAAVEVPLKIRSNGWGFVQGTESARGKERV